MNEGIARSRIWRGAGAVGNLARCIEGPAHNYHRRERRRQDNCVARDRRQHPPVGRPGPVRREDVTRLAVVLDRKSTRLNSSHTVISYAVFCLKKKKKKQHTKDTRKKKNEKNTQNKKRTHKRDEIPRTLESYGSNNRI